MQHLDWSIPRRQSWAAVLFVALKLIKAGYKAFGILAISILLKGKFSWLIFGGIILFVLLIFFVAALVQFWFFKFSIQDGILQVNQGVFFKKRIHLPVAQIQSVHTDQTLWHRITQTTRIKLDSPGSEKTEVTIDALSELDTEWLQQQLMVHRKETIAPTEQVVYQKPLLERTFTDLLKWSLTINHFQTIALIFVFGLSLWNDLEQAFNLETYDKLDQGVTGLNPGILLVIVGTMLFLFVVVVASIALTIYRWFGFTVQSDQVGFSVKAGLVHVQQWRIPFRKIQVWEFRSNWIRRFFHQIRLEWQTIGEQDEKKKQKPWAPLLGESEMKAVVEKAGYGFPTTWVDAKGIHFGYMIRFIVVSSMLISIGVCIVWFNDNIWILVGSVGLAILIVLHGFVFQKRFRYQMSTDGLWIRKGIWGTQRFFIPWKNIQFQTLSQSIFQKKSGLASLYLRTAAKSYNLPFISQKSARDISFLISTHLRTDQAKWN
jgi:putative membrane protein